MVQLTKTITYSSSEWEEVIQSLVNESAENISNIVRNRIMADLGILTNVGVVERTAQPAEQLALTNYVAAAICNVISSSGYQLSISHKSIDSNHFASVNEDGQETNVGSATDMGAVVKELLTEKDVWTSNPFPKPFFSIPGNPGVGIPRIEPLFEESLEEAYNSVMANIPNETLPVGVTAERFGGVVKSVLGTDLEPQILALIGIWLQDNVPSDSRAKTRLLKWYRALSAISASSKWPLGRWRDQLSRDYFFSELSDILVHPLPPMVVPEEVRAIVTPMFVDEYAKQLYLLANVELSSEFRMAIENAYNSGDQTVRDQLTTMKARMSGPYNPAAVALLCKEILDYLSTFTPNIFVTNDAENFAKAIADRSSEINPEIKNA